MRDVPYIPIAAALATGALAFGNLLDWVALPWWTVGIPMAAYGVLVTVWVAFAQVAVRLGREDLVR